MEDEKILPLGTKEYEYSTFKVMRIDDDYFLIEEDGGTNGAYGSGHDATTIISRQEARRQLLEWGVDAADIARWTR